DDVSWNLLNNLSDVSAAATDAALEAQANSDQKRFAATMDLRLRELSANPPDQFAQRVRRGPKREGHAVAVVVHPSRDTHALRRAAVERVSVLQRRIVDRSESRFVQRDSLLIQQDTGAIRCVIHDPDDIEGRLGSRHRGAWAQLDVIGIQIAQEANSTIETPGCFPQGDAPRARHVP